MKNLQVIKKHNDRMALVISKTNVVKSGGYEITEALKCAILIASYRDIAKYNCNYN